MSPVTPHEKGGLDAKQGSPACLALGTSFTEDNFFTDWGRKGDVLGMIQGHYIYCALYFYYYYISSTSDHQALIKGILKNIKRKNLYWNFLIEIVICSCLLPDSKGNIYNTFCYLWCLLQVFGC